MTEHLTLPGASLDILPLATDPVRHPDGVELPEPSVNGTSAGDPSVAPPTKREREAGWMQAALEVLDLTSVPMAELRVTANRMYLLMDTDRPPQWAAERYEAVVDEIEERSAQAKRAGTTRGAREVFKDSAYGSRFELYCDGALAAYIRYSIRDGELVLRALVEKPEFEGRGLWQGLVREAMLNAHKRRLRVSPRCPAAQAFLRQYPQYLALTRSVR